MNAVQEAKCGSMSGYTAVERMYTVKKGLLSAIYDQQKWNSL